jgi:hypothetical protein
LVFIWFWFYYFKFYHFKHVKLLGVNYLAAATAAPPATDLAAVEK